MRTQTRWSRRDRKRRKARWGMKMDGKSTKTVLPQLAATSPPTRRKKK